MKNKLQSVDYKVISRIYGKKRGWVFTPNHFLDLGSRKAVSSALERYQAKGTIRNLARGLYDYPRSHPKLGVLSPSTDDVAAALKGRDAIRIQPSGAYAANLLGLSEQVPMHTVYFTDGPNRRVQLGKQVIELKHTIPRNVASRSYISGLVIHALRYLGQKGVDDQVISLLRKRLSPEDKAALRKDINLVPTWVAGAIWKIARTE